jgi:hypothetical protein
VISRIPSPAQANEADFRRVEFLQYLAFGTTRRSTATSTLGVLVRQNGAAGTTLTANNGCLAARLLIDSKSISSGLPTYLAALKLTSMPRLNADTTVSAGHMYINALNYQAKSKMLTALSQLGWIAVSIASVAHLILGGIWYTVLFRRRYASVMGLDE